MPSAEKQKKQAALRGMTKKQRTRKTRRSEGHSALLFEQFMRNAPGTEDLFLAQVTNKMGAGRFTVRDDAGKVYPSIPIKGSLKLAGRAAHNAGVATAIGTGSYVLMDARITERVVDGKQVEFIDGLIHAVLSSKEAAQVRAKVGGPKSTSSRKSKASSASTLFNWGSHSANSILERAAARKAQHKKTRKVGSAAGSVVASVASSAGSASSEVLLVAGKKVYDATGEKLHGEQLRQAKRELAAAVAK